jgi:2-dehydropantoate 2-reductase
LNLPPAGCVKLGRMASLAVIGPGGVGGFLAAALTRAGERVTVVARPETCAAISQDGIRLESRAIGDVLARPAVVTDRLEEPIGVLFVATKATGLEQAMERVAVTPELVVPLLNGLDHLELLRARFGRERVVAAVIRIESDRPQPGVIVQTSPAARIDLAATDPSVAARLPALARTLAAAGLDVRLNGSEAHVMWSKLVRLNALACTTSVAERPIGAIRSDPAWRGQLLACVREGTAVANAAGAGLDPADTVAELEAAHESLGSSMQRDLAAGRIPELEAIQGSVLRAAARLGVDCPTIAGLSARIAERAGLPAPV